MFRIILIVLGIFTLPFVTTKVWAAPEAVRLVYIAGKRLPSANFSFVDDPEIYTIGLLPDLNVYGAVVTLTLDLRDMQKYKDETNLLDASGTPGAKSWIFASPDFPNGVGSTPCGQYRKISVQKLSRFIYVKVSDELSFPVSDSLSQPPFMFKKFALNISSRPSKGIQYSTLCQG